MIAIAAMMLAVMASCDTKGKQGGAPENDSTTVTDNVETTEPTDDNITDGSTPETLNFEVSVVTPDLEEQYPRYEATVTSGDKTIQVLKGKTEDYPKDMLGKFGQVTQVDVNFDGYTDLLICLGEVPASDQTFLTYDAWIYNPEKGQFRLHEGFRDIYNAEVDAANKRILSHYLVRDGKTKYYNAVRLKDDGTVEEMGEGWTE
jgi:hypothetical protein